jgi:hypothetical protein
MPSEMSGESVLARAILLFDTSALGDRVAENVVIGERAATENHK